MAAPTAPVVPRLLSAPLAAAYIGISPRSFDKLWRTGGMPQPLRIGRRQLWDGKILDAFIDHISGITQPAKIKIPF